MLKMEFKTDWTITRNRKQKNKRENRRDNASRKKYQYTGRDQILIKNDSNRKYGQNAYKGPYQSISVVSITMAPDDIRLEEFKILLISEMQLLIINKEELMQVYDFP